MHKDFHNYFPNLFGVHKNKQSDYQLLTQKSPASDDAGDFL